MGDIEEKGILPHRGPEISLWSEPWWGPHLDVVTLICALQICFVTFWSPLYI